MVWQSIQGEIYANGWSSKREHYLCDSPGNAICLAEIKSRNSIAGETILSCAIGEWEIALDFVKKISRTSIFLDHIPLAGTLASRDAEMKVYVTKENPKYFAAIQLKGSGDVVLERNAEDNITHPCYIKNSMGENVIKLTAHCPGEQKRKRKGFDNALLTNEFFLGQVVTPKKVVKEDLASAAILTLLHLYNSIILPYYLDNRT